MIWIFSFTVSNTYFLSQLPTVTKPVPDFRYGTHLRWGFPDGSVIKNLPANAGDARNVNSTPGSGRSPGEGNGNPLQYSRLENSIVRGAWRATVPGAAKSQI